MRGMTPRRLAIAALALALVAPAAVPQHRHDHKPRHGGLIRETGGFVYELRATPASIAVWVTDESDKPVPTRGSTAKVTLVDSGMRVEVRLAPAGDNRFEAGGAFPVRAGVTALLEVAVGGKTIARLRYTLK
jgi:hypothetical protein